MNVRIASMAAALMVAAHVVTACGGSPADAEASAAASTSSTGMLGAPDPAASWVGTYTGTMTLVRGAFTYSRPTSVRVENPYPGVVRVPVEEMCPSVEYVEFAPPEALVIVLAEPGAWSFALPTGDLVRLGSIHPRFEADGRTLTIAFHGVVDGHDLDWNFTGAR